MATSGFRSIMIRRRGGSSPSSSSSAMASAPIDDNDGGQGNGLQMIYNDVPNSSSSFLGSTLRDERQEFTLWRNQLARLGHATCLNKNCRLSFLSFAGIVGHQKFCAGLLRPGDYVVCQYCSAAGEDEEEVRFRRYKSLKTHQERIHRMQETIIVDSDNKKRRKIGGDPDLHSDQTARIMAQSRLISLARPRGRPPAFQDPWVKAKERNQMDLDGLQYADTFDINSKQEAFSYNNQRYVIMRVEDDPLRPHSEDENEEVKDEVKDEQLPWFGKKEPEEEEEENEVGEGSNNVIAVKDEDVEDREHVLAEQAVKLATYEDHVLRSERLAEEARRKAVLVEKEARLKRWEEELQQREAEARKKIAEAVLVLEKSREMNEINAEDDEVEMVIKPLRTYSRFQH